MTSVSERKAEAGRLSRGKMHQKNKLYFSSECVYKDLAPPSFLCPLVISPSRSPFDN